MGVDALDESKLILCAGCICCNTSLYPQFPACCGCSGKLEILCCLFEYCLKPATKPLKCFICNLEFKKKPSVLLKTQTQCLFCVESCALPPDKEVPATLAYLGVACYPKFGICKTQGELTGGLVMTRT